MDENRIKQTPTNELTLLMQFQSVLPMDEFQKRASNRDILAKFSDIIPEFHDVFAKLDEISRIYRSNPGYSWMLSAYKQKPEEVKRIEKDIRHLQKEIQKKVKPIVKVYNQLKKEGRIISEKPRPKKNGVHFKVARKAASELCALWFVDQTYLFGSVAKGKEKANSDIDLIVRNTAKGAKAPLAIVLRPIKERFEKAHGIKLHILRLTKHMKDIGFYEPYMMMEEKSEYPIKIGDYEKVVRKNDISGFLVETLFDDALQYVLFEIGENKYDVLLLYGAEQAAYFALELDARLFGRYRIIAQKTDLLEKIRINYEAYQDQVDISASLKKMLNTQKKHAVTRVFDKETYDMFTKRNMLDQFIDRR